MAATWTATDPRWQALSPYQKAAAMALMEANGADPNQARNALGAMINRAGKSGEDLGNHVSGRIYQPTFEPTQQARLDRILKMPAFGELSQWAERRAQGYEPDPVDGATHFLAHEPVMERLRAQNPNKYRSWVNWTGYDANGGQYANVTTRDPSHAFLAPEGRYSVPLAQIDPEDFTPAGPVAAGIDPDDFTPGGSLVGPSPSPSAVASTSPPRPERTWGDTLSGYGQAALKIAKAAQPAAMPAMRPMQLIHADPIRPNPRGLQMAAASIPYAPKSPDAAEQALRLARGGKVEPVKDETMPLNGAGRFAEPRIAPRPEGRDMVRGWMDRINGVGRLPYAAGGAIDDTGSNLPETPDSLKAQQHEVLVGRRPAMMFPAGTPELPLPQGLRRVETPRGVFHFDPLQISAQDIADASAEGRENEILGLGPLSKDDVIEESLRTGEKPVAITQRDKMGNEIRSSLATPSSIPDQSDEILRSAPDDHSVDVEPVGDVLRGRMGDGAADQAMRMARAEGGKVAEAREWNVPPSKQYLYWLTDKLFGPNATPRDFEAVAKIAGPQNPFNAPAQVLEGTDRIKEGVGRGDYGEAALGGLEAIGGLAPAAGAAAIARSMGPSARSILRSQNAEAKAAGHGSERPLYESGGNRTFDRMKDDIASKGSDAERRQLADKMRDAGSAKDMEREFRRSLSPWDRYVYSTRIEGVPSVLQPGHIAAQGAGLAAADTVMDLGIMPWSWNRPGSVQNDARKALNSDDWARNRAKAWAEGKSSVSPQTLDDSAFSQAWKTAAGRAYTDIAEEMTGRKIGYDPQLPPEFVGGDGDDPGLDRAMGGAVGGGLIEGALHGATGGRADQIPGAVRSGAHVLPADIVSHMGQGNTQAGVARLDQLFKSGPYGMKLPQMRRGRRGFADGGAADDPIPVMLSDGEYVIPPEVVAEIGGGDVGLGHDVLDQWILSQRQDAINTLASLPPPATD